MAKLTVKENTKIIEHTSRLGKKSNYITPEYSFKVILEDEEDDFILDKEEICARTYVREIVHGYAHMMMEINGPTEGIQHLSLGVRPLHSKRARDRIGNLEKTLRVQLYESLYDLIMFFKEQYDFDIEDKTRFASKTDKR